MGGITMVSALEIFTNPFDLSITVSKDAVMISRGPGHNFKPIVSGEWKFENQKIAAEEVGKILKSCIKASSDALSDSENIFAKIINPRNEDLKDPEKATVLTNEMVDEIVKMLSSADEKGAEVGTYKPPFVT